MYVHLDGRLSWRHCYHMSRANQRQYAAHLAATGRAPKKPIDITGCAPIHALRTVPPPPARDHERGMLEQAAQLEAEASRMLARAADLKRAAGRDALTPAAQLLEENDR